MKRLNTEDFFPQNTSVSKNVTNWKQRNRFLHRFLEISGNIAVDFTAKKAPVLFNAEGTFEARGKVI